MSIARWEPFSEIRRMHDDMDRLMERFWPSTMIAPWGMEAMVPCVDVFEKDGNIVVKAELPGLNKEDLEITATEDSISLKGEFKKEEETREEGYYRQERRIGRFFRTIPMPEAIKPDQVKASFKEGVLEITAQRSEAAKPKEMKVPIEV